MKAEREEDQQQTRDDEVGYLREAVGTEGEPARPSARWVSDGTPSDPEHEIVLERAQREKDAREEDWPYNPRERC